MRRLSYQKRIDTHMNDLVTAKHAARMFGYSKGYLAALCRRGMVYGIQAEPGCGWYTGKNGLPVYHTLVSISSVEDYIVNRSWYKARQRKNSIRKVAEIKLKSADKRLDKAA
jgi:hypothetical protein